MVRFCLDRMLKKLNMSRYELAKRTGIQYQIVDNYYKNKVKRYDCYIIERFCDTLNCDVKVLIELIKE